MQYENGEKLKNENRIEEIVNFIKNVNLLNILYEDDIFSDDKKTNNYFTIEKIDNKTEPLTCYLMIIHYTTESEYFNPYEPSEVRHSLVLETNNQKINERIQLNDWREAGEYEEVEWNVRDTSEYIQKLKEFLSDYIISDEYKSAIKTIWDEISIRVDKLHKDVKLKDMACNNIIEEYSKI
jgi:hypothetical protein